MAQFNLPVAETENKFWSWFNRGGSFASVVALLVGIFLIPQPFLPIFYASYLILLTTACVSYTIWLAGRKLHRFAQAATYVHYVAHEVRDALHESKSYVLEEEDARAATSEKLKERLSSILDVISSCFAILTGTQCSVCLKEFIPVAAGEKGTLQIKTLHRDRLSQQGRGKRDIHDAPHVLHKDTPCHSLFTGAQGCSRFFVSNDVKSDFMAGSYDSPRFAIEKPQRAKKLWFLQDVTWPLPYKSALVAPIRYLVAYPRANAAVPDEATKVGKFAYCGFLCIDSPRKNSFKGREICEVTGAFADLLYIFLSELNCHLNPEIKKNQDHGTD